MVLKAFAILDTKANAFMPPFFMPAVGMATRAFGDLARDKDSQVAKHPGDYRLAEIGTFDDNNGELVSIGGPRFLGFATDFMEA